MRKKSSLTKSMASGIGTGWAAYTFGMSIHTHKELAHRTVDLHPKLRTAGRLVTWLASGFDSHTFGLNHRIHHAIADGPHDELAINRVSRWHKFLRSRDYNQLGSKKLELNAAHVTFGTGIVQPDDPLLIQLPNGHVEQRRSRADRLFRTGPVGPLAAIALGGFLGGKKGALFASTTIATVAGISSVVNVFGHDAHGTGPDNTGVDRSGVLSIVTAGESYHRTHHMQPEQLRSAPDGHLDIAASATKALARIGLATIK